MLAASSSLRDRAGDSSKASAGDGSVDAVAEEVVAEEVAAEEVVAEEEVAAGQAMVTSQTRKLAARKRIAEKICTLLQMQRRRVDREIPKFLDLRAPKKLTKCLETWRIK